MASQYIKLPVVSGSGPSAGVDSFNGRTGVVVSQAGDYAAGIVGNVPAGNIAATNVQDAINELDTEKQAVITGAASTITSSNLTADRAVVSNGSGKVAVSAVTSTELGYLSGVTSAVQTQLNAKQPLDSDLTAIAALATNGLIARTGAGTVATRTVTGTPGEISVTNGDGVSGNPTLALTATGVTAGTYTNANVTVSAKGRVTAITNGSASIPNQDLVLHIADDFTGNSVGLGSYGFTSATSGGATTAFPTGLTDATTKAQGVVELRTSSGANSRVAVLSSLNAMCLGYASFDFRTRLTVDSIGTVADGFETTFGLIDTTGAPPNHQNGVYFKFSGDGVNTNWQCVAATSSVRTTVTTTVPVLVNNFEIFQISINETGTNANFYINGVLVATITTNIPVGPLLAFGMKVAKTTATTSAVYRTYADWLSLIVSYSAPRG